MNKAGRRAQILGHAKAVFARKGYHDAGVSDIVDRAGIARGTFYLYFQGKRDVFGTLLDDFLRELTERIRAVDLSPGHADPRDQVRANVRRVLELVDHDPAMMRILLHQAHALDRQSRTALARFYEHVLGMLRRSLDHGIRLGIVRPCDTATAASCILGSVKEIAGVLAHRRRGRPDLDRLAGEIVALGLTGVLRTR